MPTRAAPDTTASALGLLLGIVFGALGSILTLTACAPAPKVACAIVDLADAACGAFVTVKMPDGTIVRVPKNEVRNAAQRSVELGTDGK